MKVEFYTTETDMLDVKNKLVKVFPKLTSIVFDCKKQDEDKWISVKDRLPKEHKKVLCLGSKGGVYVGEQFKSVLDGRAVWLSYNQKHLTVTHWMPLPQPPKEKEQ